MVWSSVVMHVVDWHGVAATIKKEISGNKKGNIGRGRPKCTFWSKITKVKKPVQKSLTESVRKNPKIRPPVRKNPKNVWGDGMKVNLEVCMKFLLLDFYFDVICFDLAVCLFVVVFIKVLRTARLFLISNTGKNMMQGLGKAGDGKRYCPIEDCGRELRIGVTTTKRGYECCPTPWGVKSHYFRYTDFVPVAGAVAASAPLNVKLDVIKRALLAMDQKVSSNIDKASAMKKLCELTGLTDAEVIQRLQVSFVYCHLFINFVVNV